MAKKEIKIGKSLKEGSAGNARTVLEARYPGQQKAIEDCIKKNFDVDEGAKKLNEGGNSSTASSKNSTSK